MKEASELDTWGGKILRELHEIVNEVGAEAEMAANNAELEMSHLRQWSRDSLKPGSFGSGNGAEARMTKTLGEALIRVGRACGAARRAGKEAENLEDMVISTLSDLWPIFAANSQKPERKAEE